MKILFVCSGNTCRSPMAEALCQKYYPMHQCASAGLAAQDGVTAHLSAKSVMEKRGLSLETHRAKKLKAEMIKGYDLVLAMEHRQAFVLKQLFAKMAEKIYGLKEFVGEKGDVQDPYGGTEETYEACAKELEALIEKMEPYLVSRA